MCIKISSFVYNNERMSIMISDVLSDSLARIEGYQSRFPGSYEDTRAEIEQVKQAMTRLLIRLDTPPGMTHEGWDEGMIRLAGSDPIRFKELMANRIYQARKGQISETLGPDDPLLVRLHEAEQKAGTDDESELAEALEAYTDPSNPEYDPEFDREIRKLRPDWFDDVDQD